jgi:hypothetical protein
MTVYARDQPYPCAEAYKLLQQAYVAKDVYGYEYGGEVPGASDYKRISDSGLRRLGLNPSDFRNDSTGFYASLYQNSADGSYTVAFRGTEGLFAAYDWRTNFGQGVGLVMAQYRAAANLGAVLGAKFGENISGIGHSLGGGLDTVAALRGGFSATNFNSAGVSPGVAASLNVDLNQSSQSITSYSVPGDALSQVVNKFPLVPGTNGKRLMLADPGSISIFGINRHLMDDAITSIKNELRMNHCD